MVVDVKILLEKTHAKKSLFLLSNATLPHLILILDKQLEKIPWESLPCLSHRSISRLPSFSFLKDRVQKSIVNYENSFYILNPSQDLKSTQELFEPVFAKMESWKGFVAQKPLESDILENLEKKDLFIYLGHGGCEQYVRSHKIRNLSKVSVTLLMGCSSGKLHSYGDYDTWGTVLDYLMAGCPAIVANLWDVTDKDLDRFSLALLGNWGILGNGKESLTQSVASARNACVLKYLVGAAPVVYGIPIYLG